ncbi:hypothetical protein ABBQ32_002894 [Trebouxia sp. C0010 RCD-2024]
MLMRQPCPSVITLIPAVIRCMQAPDDQRSQGLLSWLKHAAKRLKRNVLAVYYATQDPDVGWAPRCIAGFALAYALSPLDLIPDFIPVLGILDDLILLPGMLWLAIRLIPEDVMLRAQTRADEEPLRLQNNWVTACCIFVMWDASATGLLYLVCKKLGTPWWQVHWWTVAVTAVTVMILCEVAFVVHTLVAEKQTALQSGELTSPDSGVHAALLSTPDDSDQLQHDAHANV